MQSRQIQTFGLIGTSVLILFIVIFLGKDFHKLYQYYMNDIALSGMGDEQIVMESHAVENLKNILNEEGSRMLAGYDKEKSVQNKADETEKIIPAAVKTDKKTVLPTSVKSTVQKNPPKAVSEAVQKTVSERTPASVTKKLRYLLGGTPFFHNGLQLTDANTAVLDQVAAQLQKLPYSYKLEVEGHTEKGAGKYFSQKMAEETAAYLKKKLPSVKIKSIGYGSLYPVSDNIQDLANRRIEIIVRRSNI